MSDEWTAILQEIDTAIANLPPVAHVTPSEEEEWLNMMDDSAAMFYAILEK